MRNFILAFGVIFVVGYSSSFLPTSVGSGELNPKEQGKITLLEGKKSKSAEQIYENTIMRLDSLADTNGNGILEPRELTKKYDYMGIEGKMHRETIPVSRNNYTFIYSKPLQIDMDIAVIRYNRDLLTSAHY